MFTINATIRKDFGKGSSRRLRIANEFPAIIYGGNNIQLFIKLKQNIFYKKKENFDLSMQLIIVIDNKKIIVKIQEIQNHPFKKEIMHIDFVLI